MAQQPINEVIRDIHQAWRDGRSVVPVIGAGFSAEAGVPTIDGVVRYLAQLRGFIRDRAYLPQEAGPAPVEGESAGLDGLRRRGEKYEEEPLLFVREHGWPGPHELYEDYAHWLGEQPVSRYVEEETRKQLDDLTRLLYPEQDAYLCEALNEAYRPPEGPLAPRVANSERWRTLGRWPDLVHQATGGEAMHTRGLFERLQHGRRPGLSHRYLAMLTRLLGVRLLFSTTYDELLEKALRGEGVGHEVFGLEGGRRFPPAELLRPVTALVRMDGDPRDLLTGGAIYLPLDKQAIEALRACLPAEPLLLVMGSSGRDRRVLDLVRHAAERPRASLRGPAVIWLHYEEVAPQAVTSCPELAHDGRALTAQVTHPGLFLEHLYASLTTRFPASRTPYPAHSPRPIGLDPPDDAPEPADPKRAGVRVFRNEARTCFLFSSLDPERPPTPTQPTASSRLSSFINNDLAGHIPIWIDLESQHTLAGVIGAVIDHCRVHDPELPPSVLSLDEHQNVDLTQKKGCARVLDALGRGRYALALDCLEGYTWPHTVHHGDLETDGKATKRRNALIEFIRLLFEGAARLHGSVICVGVNFTNPRRSDAAEKMEPDLSSLTGLLPKEWLIPHQKAQSLPHPLEPDSGAAELFHQGVVAPDEMQGISTVDWASSQGPYLAWLGLSCFRRTRHLVALRTLLGPLFKDPGGPSSKEALFQKADKALEALCDKGYLLPVAGGGYWMNQLLRDGVYSGCSRFTDTNTFKGLAGKFGRRERLDEGDLGRSALQCLLLALHQDRVGRLYYYDNYAQSQDAVAFFEYVYHRVSCIRYLAKLLLLREMAGGRSSEPWQRVGEACAKTLNGVSEDYLGIRPVAIRALLGVAGGEGTDLQERHARELRGLRLSWRRHRVALQKAAPAEQIISWCRWLIEDDLRRLSAVRYRKEIGFVDFVPSPSFDGPPFGWEYACEKSEQEVAAFRETLYDLWAQCCRERSDYEECVRIRLKQSIRLACTNGWGIPSFRTTWEDVTRKHHDEEAAVEKVAEDAESEVWAGYPQSNAATYFEKLLPPKETPPGQPAHLQQLCKWWLDVAESLSAMDAQKSFEGEAGRTDRVIPLLASLRKNLLQPTQGDDDGQRDLDFRSRQIEVEHRLAGVTFWQKGYLYDIRDGAPQKTGKEVFALCRKALIDVRRHDPDVNKDYFKWRAVFMMARGRARVLFRPPSFPDVYRDLEMARGWPRSSDDLLRVRVDFCAVELALIEADEILTREAGLRENEGYPVVAPPPAGELLRRADAKYATARGYLKRLPDQLLGARRNTVGWKSFFRLAAQHLVEKNLWVLADALERPAQAEEGWTVGLVSGMVRRIRLGLRAIRSGLDRDLDPAKPDPWLLQAWGELFFSSFLLGRVARDGLAEKPDQQASLKVQNWKIDGRSLDPLFDRQLLAMWLTLNRSVGLLAEADEPISSLTKLWNDHCSLSPMTRTGLAMRRDIIKAANTRQFNEAVRGLKILNY